ncbi:ABC transporter permease [Virgisporangium aurantiacum]|uniref:ABC transporter permease n=1 Tax=Virgisporangium aurantiacum TaxID=175570 RepID=A0A8J3ZHP0_9ACTN|nr:ABC transporter permease [Virgisporangium aurantiacum]GIJ64322.1 ABC transporter permease [Virgisporangium aurantiacum]
MSTVALTRPPIRVTQARVTRSEWIKFWSLRSTVATMVVAAALLIGIGLLAASIFTGDTSTTTTGAPPGPGSGASDPVSASLAGVTFAQLVFGALGVLFMASEYGTGQIRSSLAAVPKRLPVLWAKITVFAAVVFTVAFAATAIAFTGGQAIIGDGGASWSDPGVARAVIGTAVVLTGSGILGIGLGSLLRSTPAAISTLFGVLFLLTGVAELLLPDGWSTALQYLPSNASSAFTAVTQQTDALTPWAGLAVFLGYLAAVIGAAAWRLKHSDV